MSFIFDESKMPKVDFVDNFINAHGNQDQHYKAGTWNFSRLTDNDLEFNEASAYAWLAWNKFLKEQ